MREDPIPTWDGTPDAWERYKLQVEYYLKTRPPWEAKYLLAKLIRSLTGKCWSLIEKLPQSSRAQLEESPEVFLQFLKKHLLEGVLPEVGRVFRNYLTIRRQKQESMMLYCLRHRESLSKLKKAMSSVETDALRVYLTKGLKGIQQEEESEEEEEDEEDSQPSHTPSETSELSYKKWVPRKPAPSPAMTKVIENLKAQGRSRMHRPTAGDSDKGSTKSKSTSSHKSQQPKASQWTDEEWKQWKYGHWKSDQGQLTVPLLPREELLEKFQAVARLVPDGGENKALLDLLNAVANHWREDLIPALLSGWLLLQRSGLSASERATVVAASSFGHGEVQEDKEKARLAGLALDRVEAALKTQWQDEELLA